MILTGTHCTQNVPKFHIPRPSTWFHKNCAFFSPIHQLRRKPDTVTNQHVNLWVCHGNHSYALCASRIYNYVCIVSSWPILTLPQNQQGMKDLVKGGRQAAKQAFIRLETRVLRPDKTKQLESGVRAGQEEGEGGVRRKPKPHPQEHSTRDEYWSSLDPQWPYIWLPPHPHTQASMLTSYLIYHRHIMLCCWFPPVFVYIAHCKSGRLTTCELHVSA